MITASHNQISDNGVKIADPSGGMMTQDWEPFADAVANAPDPQHLLQVLATTYVKLVFQVYTFFRIIFNGTYLFFFFCSWLANNWVC